VEDDTEGDPSLYRSSLLQSARNTINPVFHMLQVKFQYALAERANGNRIKHSLPVSLAAGFLLSASFPVESKRHSYKNHNSVFLYIYKQ
jgi:hypothetical protein